MKSSETPVAISQIPHCENGVVTGQITTIVVSSQAQATEINALLVQWSMQQANKGVKQ